MYLALLNKREKELFLGLAYDLASADGDYSTEEQAVMNEYCQEMQFEFQINTMVKKAETIIDEIKKSSSDKVKKIFIFELIGLAMADGHFDAKERKLINKMEEEFDVESGLAKRCEEILTEYIAFQGRINQLILG